MDDVVDYVIVGSGAAGCALAYRLARSGRSRVVVVEAGGWDIHPLHQVPKGFFFTLAGNRYVSRYGTRPIAGTETVETWVRGRVVGGSTTINGMMYARGAEPDFLALQKHVQAEHWGWASVLAAYRAMENHALGASPSRGAGGPLAISVSAPGDELTERVLAAGESLGWERVADINEGDHERIGATPSTIHRGRRVSAASAFLRPALRTGRVRLLTRARVGRLLTRDGRVLGVEGRRRGQRFVLRARREVVLACGTVETPLLLERSGIGRADVVHRLGVDLVADSPGIGENIVEHHSAGRVQVRLTRRLGATLDLNTPLKQAARGAVYLARRTGPIATAGYDITFHCRSEPGVERPDLSGSVTPYALDTAATGMRLARHPGLLIGLSQTRAETKSAVHASGPDAGAPPIITPHYFETETDARAAGRTIARMRELVAARPLADVVEFEEVPGHAVSNDPAAIVSHARRAGGTIHHAVGSCAMGPDPHDPVDAHLRVRGVDGLRVADASVLPFHVSANPAAPVMAVGWIAGTLLEDD